MSWSARTPGLTGLIAEPDSVLVTAANGSGCTVATEDSYSDLPDIVGVGRRADNIVTYMFRAWPVTVKLAGIGRGVVTSPYPSVPQG